MKIYVDDERDAPGKDWQLFRSFTDLRELLVNNYGRSGFSIEWLSLDHDMGDGEETGYTFSYWLEEQNYKGIQFPIGAISVHSANPAGKTRMEFAIQNAGYMLVPPVKQHSKSS